MKMRITLALAVLVLLTLGPSAWAQGPQVSTGQAIQADTSPPLRDMVIVKAAPSGVNREIPIRPKPNFGRNPANATPDGGLQSSSLLVSSLGPTPGPLLSAPGLSEQDNVNVVGGAIVPPDTNGDIGLDGNGNKIYIQYINLVWGVFRASDGALINGPFAGNTFWSGFGGPCETNNDGDPVVLYDDEAGQWFFSQFSINQGIQCVAISTTSDPLGPYHRYAFVVTPGGSNDYPKLGVWDDGTTGSAGQSAYTFTLRDFGGAGGAFSVSAGVMERDKMLVGDPSAVFIKFSNPCVAGDCIEGQLPQHLAGPPPPAGTCPTFWTAVDAAFDDSPFANDGYRNHTLCVDWANLGNSTYTEGPLVVAGSNFDRFIGSGFSACIGPVNGGENLDCQAAFTMYRAQYRWDGANARVVFNTTVDAGGDRAGIRWAQPISATGDSAWSLQQDGTYAPADGLDRWMGSIAQDQDGNIALGYSVTGPSLFPSVRYATRMAGDPAGTLPGGEVSCHEGMGAQVGSANRWGDYSSMSVDPVDGCTFWYTQEYYETTGSFDFSTRICSFKFPDCPGICVPTEVGTELTCNDGEDNDCDLLFDCQDPDCDSDPACICIPEPEVCNNGMDEDCDDLVDCDDPECDLDPACIPPEPPVNDLCADAIEITCPAGGGSVTVSGDTTLATFDNAGTCVASNTAPGVWYKVSHDGLITASTCNAASYDTMLSVYGGGCGALGCVASNDDTAGCGFTTELTWVGDGSEQLILVHGFGSAVGAFDLTLTLTCTADLSITKTDGVAAAIPGQSLTYTIVALNNGPGADASAMVADSFPATLSCAYTSVAEGGAMGNTTAGMGDLSETLSMPAGSSVTYTAICTIDPAATGTLSNTAIITSSLTDPVSGNNSATDNDTVLTPQADLSITKDDSPDPVVVGSALTYTLNVLNGGPSTATSVSVTDTLPVGVSLLSASGTGWSCDAVAGVVTCTRASLTVGPAPPVTINVTALGEGGTLTNNVSVSASSTDPETGNNSASETTTVTPQADLSITKDDSPDPVVVGSALTYTLNVLNGGPSTATSVSVTDTLPVGVSLLSASGTGWSCGAVAGVVTCTRASLAVGPAPPVAIHVTAPREGGTLTNSVSVSSSTDPVAGNNSASEVTMVTPQADLSITKSDRVNTAVAGGSLIYTIIATNNGPSSVAAATLTDTLPWPLTCVFTSRAAGGAAGNTSGRGHLAQTLSMPPGSAVTYTVSCEVSPTAGTSLSNTAEINSTIPDAVPDNNSATDIDTVRYLANLAVTIVDEPDPVVAGGMIVYTIQVTNTGPSDASGVTVGLGLPSGATFVSAAGADWSCTADTGVTCGRPRLGASETAPPITIEVVAPDEPGLVVNEVMVSSNDTDTHTSDNSAVAETLVETAIRADLVVELADSSDPVQVGENLTYDVLVTNKGLFDAEATVLAFDSPAGAGLVLTEGCIEDPVAVPLCSLGTVPSATRKTVKLTVTAPSTPGTIHLQVAANSATFEANPGDENAQEETVVVPVADLVITQSDSIDPVVGGQDLTYTVMVSNNGPFDAENVVASRVLSNGVPVVSAPGCPGALAGLPCDLGTLAVGATATYSLTVTAPPGTAGVVVHTATVRSSTFEANPGDESNTETTALEPEVEEDPDNPPPPDSPPDPGDINVDIALTLTGPDTAIPGEDVSYTVTVTNHGPLHAAGVKVASLSSPAIVSASWTCSAGDGAACGTGSGVGNLEDFVDLEVGASATYQITAMVASNASGVLENTAFVVTGAAGTADSNPSNDSATITTELKPTADLDLDLTNDRDTAVFGKLVVYTIVVTNNGPSDSEATLTATFALEGLTWFCMSTTGRTCASGLGDLVDTFTLEAGEVRTYRVLGTISEDASGVLFAEATLSPSTSFSSSSSKAFTDPDLSNNTAVDTDTIVSGQVLALDEAAVTVSDGGNPSIAFNEEGEALVVYERAEDGIVRVMAQRLAATGIPIGDEIEISGGAGGNPKVAFDRLTVTSEGNDAPGAFLTVWDELGLGPPSRVLGQLVRGGRKIGPEQVLSTRDTDQVRPDVATNPKGGFIAVWESDQVSGSDAPGSETNESGIFARFLNRLGQPLAPPEERIDVSKLPDPGRPAVAADHADRYLIIWDTPGPEGVVRKIVGQRLDSVGVLVGNLIEISGDSDANLTDPELVFDPGSERYLAVWRRGGMAGGIETRLLNAAGRAVGESMLIGEPGDRQPELSVSPPRSPQGDSTRPGNYVAVWERPFGVDHSVTFGQMIDASGRAVGREFRVRSGGGRNARVAAEVSGARPAIAFVPPDTTPGADGADIFFVVWDDESDAAAGEGEIKNQRYAVTADLLLTVFDDPDPILAEGETPLTYTVSVSNLSTAAAEDVVVTHAFLPGVTPVATIGCAEDPSAFDVCSLATIEGGVTREYRIETVVAAGQEGTLPLSALVSSSTPDPDEGDNSVTEITRLGQADLHLALEAIGEFQAGRPALWRLNVTNGGPSTSDGVVLSPQLAPGVGLVETRGCAEDPAGVPACTLGDLASGEEHEVELMVDLSPSLTSVSQAATVVAVTEDPELSDNVASVAVELVRPELALMLDAPLITAAGSVFEVTVTVVNQGAADAEDVVLSIPLPSGLMLVSSAGCAEDPTGLPLCTLGRVMAGATRRARFRLEVDPALDDSVLHLGARVSSSSTTGLLTATVEVTVGDPTVLSLLGGRFRVRVDWRNARGGTTGSGIATAHSDNTGFFWFFQPDNVELLVKVLDGGPINGNFWFFYGGLSDVEYTITVTDTETGAERIYHNPQGEICGQGDTSAFPGADGSFALEPRAMTHHPPVKGGDCIEGLANLCLGDGRFRVDVEWIDFAGLAGRGQAVTGTDDTGYFWFFNEENLELAVKVLDGRQINGRFWVFYSGLSNVEYTITVTDTEPGAVRQYFNPLGNICGRADTGAF